MTQKEWLTDIADACDELGYAIAALTPGQIDLIALDPHGATVSIKTVLLSGATLRLMLRPVEWQQEIRRGRAPDDL